MHRAEPAGAVCEACKVMAGVNTGASSVFPSPAYTGAAADLLDGRRMTPGTNGWLSGYTNTGVKWIQLALDASYDDIGSVAAWTSQVNDWLNYAWDMDVWLMKYPNNFTDAVQCANNVALSVDYGHVMYCPPATGMKYVHFRRPVTTSNDNYLWLSEVEIYRNSECVCSLRLGSTQPCRCTGSTLYVLHRM